MRPGASISEEAYRELINSTIPPAPKTPVPVRMGFQAILDECETLVRRVFNGRLETFKVVRTGGSITVIVQKDKQHLGRIIVSKRFGQEIYHVWVQHPTSGSGSCSDVAYLMDVAQLLSGLGTSLKSLIAER